jgi:hypothetical protein
MKRVFFSHQSIKIVIALCILIGCSINLRAQNANPKRNVLFTLGINEVICENEYFVAQYLNQNHFTCIICDTLKETRTVVFDGKRIISTNEAMWINNINLNEVNGYVLCYEKVEGDYYVNYKGKEDGPFEDLSFYHPYNSSVSNSYEYFYKLAGRWWGCKDGQKPKLILEEKIEETKPKISYNYEDGKYYVKINDVLLSNQKGYNDVSNLQMNENGKYAYCFEENDKYYVNINGTISTSYDNVQDLTLDNNGMFYYIYRKDNDGVIYQNNNGRMSKAESLNWVLYGGYEIEIFSTNKENSFFSNYQYEYVVIDGKRFGKSPALRAWYEKDKNTFIWNAIEGKELVVYEYKLE